jgi:hypothetical protein
LKAKLNAILASAAIVTWFLTLPTPRWTDISDPHEFPKRMLRELRLNVKRLNRI